MSHFRPPWTLVCSLVALANVLQSAVGSAEDLTLHFVDVTRAAGLTYTHGYSRPLVSADGSFDERRHFAGGVAAGDYDGDGWIDLYAIRGDIGPNLLLHNLGTGRFEDRAADAGVALAGSFGSAPLFADFDGDGRLDLLVGGVHGVGTGVPADAPVVRLFRNSGDGTFVEATEASGLSVTRDTFSAAAADFDGDGDLDLALSHWATLLVPGESSQTLWRNEGNLRFVDVSLESGITAALGEGGRQPWDFSFTPNFADIDGDRRPDLLISGDFGHSHVLRNRGDGTFADSTDRTVISDENGMGGAVGDFDNDGVLDWFVSSIWDPAGATLEHWAVSGNRLYRGEGNGGFVDATDAAGVRAGYWGWGASFCDLDNDGALDLVQTNGFGRSADYLPSAAFFADPLRVFLNDGNGSFRERSAELGLVDDSMGRGLVCFDFDRDGDLDLLLANGGQPPRLFRNDGGNRNRFLAVQVRGMAANSEGVGARIELQSGGRRQLRELRAGSNFESQDPAEAHFGLARDAVVDSLTVIWPDGSTASWEKIVADQRLRLDPPSTVTPTPSPTPSPTATQGWTPQCAGDCDGSGQVTVDEILRAVAIALASETLEVCRGLDLDHNRQVTVDEILTTVRLALEGCPV